MTESISRIDGLAVTRRPDGRYQTKVSTPGKRRTVNDQTWEGLQVKVRKMTELTHRDITPPSGTLTVATWLEIWMRDSVCGGPNPLKPQTQKIYRGLVKNHFAPPPFGRLVLSKVDLTHVEAWQTEMRNKPGIGITTANQARHTLKAAFEEAFRKSHILVNPIKKSRPIKTRRTDRKTIEHLTRTELDAFLATIPPDHRDRPWILVAFGSGMRQGEILGLRTHDIDGDWEQATTIHLTEQLTREGRDDLKTESSERDIPLNDYVRLGLKLARIQQATDRLASGGRWSNPEGYLFTKPNGSPLNHRTVSGHFDQLVFVARQAAGIPRITIHGTRHTFATILLTEGERIEVISKLLGHADIVITLKTYARLDPARAQIAVDRISALLTPAMRRELAAEG